MLFDLLINIILKLPSDNVLLKLCDFNLLTIYFRFSVRLMLSGSSALYTITFLAIRAQRFEPTPQVLHDRDPTLNPRQSRHNTSIVSRHFIYFLTLYLFVLAILLLLGSAKGTYILALIVIVQISKWPCEKDQ